MSAGRTNTLRDGRLQRVPQPLLDEVVRAARGIGDQQKRRTDLADGGPADPVE